MYDVLPIDFLNESRLLTISTTQVHNLDSPQFFSADTTE